MKILYENGNYDIELNVVDNDLTNAIYSVTCSRPDLITITQDPIVDTKFNLAIGTLDNNRVLVKMNYVAIDQDSNANTTFEYITLSKGMINDNRYYTKIEFDNLFVNINDYEDGDILSKILNVTHVGSSSGLDADTVQGRHGSINQNIASIPIAKSTKQIDKNWTYHYPRISRIRHSNHLHSKNNTFVIAIDSYDPQGQNIICDLVCDDGSVIINKVSAYSFEVTYPDYVSDTTVTYTTTVTNEDALTCVLSFDKKIFVDLGTFEPSITDIIWDDNNHEDNKNYYMLITAHDPKGQDLTYDVVCDDVNVTIVQDGTNDNIFHVTYPDYASDTTVTYTVTVTNEDLLTDEETVVKIVADVVMSGDRGVFCGGSSSAYLDIIDYVTISTPGNAIDFGDLSVSKNFPAATSNGINNRGIFGGGHNASSYYNVIEYITISTPGNVIDFGDLSAGKLHLAACSNGINERGIFGGGSTGSYLDTIDYITISTPGDATDFGDLTLARDALASCSNGINDRGIFGGGYTGGGNYRNVIDYVSISIPLDATDFGDLSSNKMYLAACSNGIGDRGIFGGGYWGDNNYTNAIDYVTISTPGNAADFGDLVMSQCQLASTSNGINDRGIFGGGYYSLSRDIIDYITISTPGNAIDFGDLSVGRTGLAACSDG